MCGVVSTLMRVMRMNPYDVRLTSLSGGNPSLETRLFTMSHVNKLLVGWTRWWTS